MRNKLDNLIGNYSRGGTVKERGIALKLKYIGDLLGECAGSKELPLITEMVESFCDILEGVRNAAADADGTAVCEDAFGEEFGTDEEFFTVFRLYFADRHAESTITDYINRIKTFRNKYAPLYLRDIYGEDYPSDGIGIGHIYANIEHILATFKPRTKTEMNIYSALKKLNEYKNHREKA